MEEREGCYKYAEDSTGRYRFIAWGPPPEPGDALCRALTGRTEAQLIQEILEGKYNLEGEAS